MSKIRRENSVGKITVDHFCSCRKFNETCEIVSGVLLAQILSGAIFISTSLFIVHMVVLT